MPKHIRLPKCVLITAFRPTKVMVKHDRDHWYVRAQQTSPLGTSWVTISRHITPEAALREAEQMAEPVILRRDTSERCGGQPCSYVQLIVQPDERHMH